MGTEDKRADSLVHGIVNDWRAAPLTLADRCLCDFGAKLTHEPSKVMKTDLANLRSHGFGDRAIHDATQVVAYFNYITRVAEALGVEPEDFIERWGSPQPTIPLGPGDRE